ncbi:MAG: PHP domain-containing protein, partial [Pirellulales bacterium]|nr:PHP domain-containing protein [Pirellulales bacterium]
MDDAAARALCVSLIVVLAAITGCNGSEPSEPANPEAKSPNGAGASATTELRGPRFRREIPWAGRGTWMKVDTHIHTRFSDGSHSVDEVAAKALEYGCDAIAITDHADRDLQAATPEYASAIEAARAKYSKLIVLAGLEWNMPPYGGREHVTLLVPQDQREWDVLAEFKARFDDLENNRAGAEGESSPPMRQAVDASSWLEAKYDGSEVKPILIFNHPSRKRDRADSLLGDLRIMRTASRLVVGFSGAPGHQAFALERLGAYDQKLRTIDRWDPAAAIIGGPWDDLLAEGEDVWAARAPSDLHRAAPGQDYWPGEFSETWVYAPEPTADGVLQALRAGSFFAVHGHIARRVALTVETEGLARMAMPGESV